MFFNYEEVFKTRDATKCNVIGSLIPEDINSGLFEYEKL